jgi:hypothetical protein
MCRFNGFRFSLESPATSLFCSYEVINILIELELRSFWSSTGGSLLKLLRPFQHKLDQWVATKFPAASFFDLKVDCQTPMHKWDMASVARFYMDTGYLTFSSKSDLTHIRLQFPNRSIGEAVANAIAEPFVSALADHAGSTFLAYQHILAGRVHDAYFEYAKIFRSIAHQPLAVRFVVFFDSLFSLAIQSHV